MTANQIELVSKAIVVIIAIGFILGACYMVDTKTYFAILFLLWSDRMLRVISDEC